MSYDVRTELVEVNSKMKFVLVLRPRLLETKGAVMITARVAWST